MTSLHESFVSQLPELEAMAFAAFSDRDPEAREEAVQNTLALAWRAFVRLEEKGELSDHGILKSIVWYSIKQTKDGRSICGCPRARDAMDQRGRRVEFQHVELRDFEGNHTSIPDRVSFRVDIPRFFSTLSERQRSIATALMHGESTSAVARQQNVTPAAISQHRQTFKRKLDEFFAA